MVLKTVVEAASVARAERAGQLCWGALSPRAELKADYPSLPSHSLTLTAQRRLITAERWLPGAYGESRDAEC